MSVAAKTGREAGRVPVVPLALGQLLSWGTLYYGIAILAQPINRETGWRLAEIFGAFSVSLLVAALMAVPVGRWLVRHGGRTVMSAGSLLAAIAFLVMAASHELPFFYLGWLLAGVAMSMTLYEAAFSTVRESAGSGFRKIIGLVTIAGGLASTLFWPLAHWLELEIGWRMTMVVFAGMHLCIGVPLHRNLPVSRLNSDLQQTLRRSPLQALREGKVITLLALSFALATLVTAAVSSHVVILLTEMRIYDWQMVLLVSLIGPMQVAGRIVELRLSHHISVPTTGRIAFMGLSIGILALYGAAASPWLAFAFAALFGAGNGVLTVVRGAAPVELLADKDYAAALGVLSAPALAARAIGPLAAAEVMGAWGHAVTIWLLFLISLAGFIIFWSVTAPLRHRSTLIPEIEANE